MRLRNMTGITITHALVSSNLDYCNILCVGLLLENELEASASPECSSSRSYEHNLLCLCNIVLWIQNEDITFKTLHTLRLGFFQEFLPTTASAHLLKCDRKRTFLIPISVEYIPRNPRIWPSQSQTISGTIFSNDYINCNSWIFLNQ